MYKISPTQRASTANMEVRTELGRKGSVPLVKVDPLHEQSQTVTGPHITREVDGGRMFLGFRISFACFSHLAAYCGAPQSHHTCLQSSCLFFFSFFLFLGLLYIKKRNRLCGFFFFFFTFQCGCHVIKARKRKMKRSFFNSKCSSTNSLIIR